MIEGQGTAGAEEKEEKIRGILALWKKEIRFFKV